MENTYIWIDEAGDLKPEHIRAAIKHSRFQQRAAEKRERLLRARLGWWNWYFNRGRLPLFLTPKALRSVSWRRVL